MNLAANRIIWTCRRPSHSAAISRKARVSCFCSPIFCCYAIVSREKMKDSAGLVALNTKKFLRNLHQYSCLSMLAQPDDFEAIYRENQAKIFHSVFGFSDSTNSTRIIAGRYAVIAH